MLQSFITEFTSYYIIDFAANREEAENTLHTFLTCKDVEEWFRDIFGPGQDSADYALNAMYKQHEDAIKYILTRLEDHTGSYTHSQLDIPPGEDPYLEKPESRQKAVIYCFAYLKEFEEDAIREEVREEYGE